VDVEWLEEGALQDILRLAGKGLPVCLKRRPVQPGRIRSKSYPKDLEKLFSLENVGDDLRRIAANPPLLEGKDLPEFWCREDGEDATLFFAHPLSRTLRYPMRYGQSYCQETMVRPVRIHWHGLTREIGLRFEPYQSLLIKINQGGELAFEDIRFNPKPVSR
jgi:hypothetical protein